jgi:hypothetical protein
VIAPLCDRGDRPPLVQLGAGTLRERHQCGIELAPGCGRGEPAIGGRWQRDAHLAPRRRAQPCGIHVLPVRHRRGVEPQGVELAQRERGEAVATALVAREPGLVGEQHAAPRTGETRGGSRTGRTGADHDDVGREVGRDAGRSGRGGGAV